MYRTRKLSLIFFTRYTFKKIKYEVSDGNSLKMMIGTPNIASDELLPVFLEFHSGAHVLNTEENLNCAFYVIHNQTQKYVVFSPEYRRAPEFQFPTAVDDAYDALLWVHKNAKTYGGDSSKIIIGGTSSGGNLAAAITMLVRDRKQPEIRIFAQILHIPKLDFFMETKSYFSVSDSPLWTLQMGLAARHMYIPSVKDWSDARASPIRAESHENLPPTFIVTCSNDALRDEAFIFKVTHQR